MRSTSADGVCGRHAAADPAQQLAEQRNRVVAHVRRGRVPRLADRDHPGGEGALLADAHRLHHPAVGQRQPLPTALVDREVGADVGAGLQQPPHPDVGRAVLLVGDREEPEVTPRAEARTSELGHRHGARRDLVLHVDRSAAPQPAGLVHDSGERRVGPVARVGRDHVEVSDERQRGCRRVRPGDAGHQVRPARVAGDQLAVHPGPGEEVAQVRRRAGLVARRPAERRFGGVAGVEPDQGTRDLEHLLVQRGHAGPSRSRTQA